MTVYVDDSDIPARVRNVSVIHDSTWCHLFADSQDELHSFAQKLGLKRSYFQPGTPRGDGTPSPLWHYDVTAGKRRQAVALGAQEVPWRESLKIMRARDARAKCSLARPCHLAECPACYPADEAVAAPEPEARPEAVAAAEVQAEHSHAWEDTGRWEKTCWGCDTVASRERGPDDEFRTEYRPTRRAQTSARLRAAGIASDDPGLAQIASWNTELAADPHACPDHTTDREATS